MTQKQYATNRELTVEFKGITVVIPAGHPVQRLVGGMSVHYCADQPHKLLDPKTQGYWLFDAVHYGIPIPPDAVVEK